MLSRTFSRSVKRLRCVFAKKKYYNFFLYFIHSNDMTHKKIAFISLALSISMALDVKYCEKNLPITICMPDTALMSLNW